MDLNRIWEERIRKAEELYDELTERASDASNDVTIFEIWTQQGKVTTAKLSCGIWVELKQTVEEMYASEFVGSEGHRVSASDGRWRLKVPKVDYFEWPDGYDEENKNDEDDEDDVGDEGDGLAS